jgi:hypothetical protein
VGDAAPNKSIIDGVDEPCAAIDKALEVLRQQAPKIDALIALLPRPNDLPTWTPPASGCGPAR